jgi:hypothetical protein
MRLVWLILFCALMLFASAAGSVSLLDVQKVSQSSKELLIAANLFDVSKHPLAQVVDLRAQLPGGHRFDTTIFVELLHVIWNGPGDHQKAVLPFTDARPRLIRTRSDASVSKVTLS